MRTAFATNPAHGQLLPLIPPAREVRDAGRDVRVVGGAGGERVGTTYSNIRTNSARNLLDCRR
jgi:hypothetical protein